MELNKFQSALKSILKDTKSYKGYAFSQEEAKMKKEREMIEREMIVEDEVD